MDAPDSCDFKVTGTVKITKHRTNGRNWIWIVSFRPIGNTFFNAVRQIQRLIKYLKETNWTLPKCSFGFMNSATLSHNFPKKKTFLISIIEKAVPTIPEMLWVVVLLDELLWWNGRMLNMKNWRCPSENAQLSLLIFLVGDGGVKFNCSVVSRLETAETVCMLEKQPVVMSVASESGRPGLSLSLSVMRIHGKAFHRANKGEVLRL